MSFPAPNNAHFITQSHDIYSAPLVYLIGSYYIICRTHDTHTPTHRICGAKHQRHNPRSVCLPVVMLTGGMLSWMLRVAHFNVLTATHHTTSAPQTYILSVGAQRHKVSVADSRDTQTTSQATTHTHTHGSVLMHIKYDHVE